MPTPLEILLDPISLIVLAMYLALMVWEAIAPARKLPKIKNWKLRGLPPLPFSFICLPTYPSFGMNTLPHINCSTLLS